jgi:hypothetical protein
MAGSGGYVYFCFDSNDEITCVDVRDPGSKEPVFSFFKHIRENQKGKGVGGAELVIVPFSVMGDLDRFLFGLKKKRRNAILRYLGR